MVVINNPTGGVYYGALVSGPVFKEIADKVYSLNLDMQKQKSDSAYVKKTIPSIKSGALTDFKNICSVFNFDYFYADADDGSDFIRFAKMDSAYRLEEIRVYEKKIPNVTGMSARDALYVLENSGVTVKLNGQGKVVEQSLAAGTMIDKKTTIELLLK